VRSLPSTAALALIAAVLAAPAAGAQETSDAFPDRADYPASEHGGNYMHNFYLPPAPSSTPWYPDWHPEDGTIAVAMGGSIWSVEPGTGVATQLTAGRAYHSSPEWSPDGRYLVYTADHNGHRIQLRVLDTRTGEDRALTDDEEIYLDPVFSPSGDRLAYVSTRPSGYFNVYVRPISGLRWAGDEIAVTTDHDYPRDRLYFGPHDMHISPAWMPSGDELLLVSNRDVALGSGYTWRVPVKENAMPDAEPVLREQSLYRTRPDVSIDGQRFVYSSTVGAADQFNNLYVQPTDGGEPYKLTFFEHDAFHPRWSPDGEWIAYVDNREGLPQLALLETYGGANRIVHVTERRWKDATGTLRVTVADADDGAATGARVHLRAADGKFYAPITEYARIGRDGDDFFHTDGTFTVRVPAGPTKVVALKGFQYRPDSTTVEVAEAGVTEVTVSLDRLADMGAEGWYSGSTHVHMNYAGNLHNTLDNLHFMSEAEDMDVINELVANKDNRILDHQFYVPGGGVHPESRPDRPLVVGQEYRPPLYGHVFMIGLSDHLISPYVTGYEGTALHSMYPTNHDMMSKAQAQGAFTGYVHPYGGDTDPLTRNLGRAKGFMMDVALGSTDALEWSYYERAGFFPLYAAWSMGFPIVATGGEDSISNLHKTAIVGSHNTYVRTEDGVLTWDRWISALRAGRAFVSNGPLVTVEVEGRGPGQTVEMDEGGGTVTLRARVRSNTPLKALMVVRDGEMVDSVAVEGATTTDGFVHEADYEVDESGWIHVRTYGEDGVRGRMDTNKLQAFTNPVWISVGGAPVRSAGASEYGVRWIESLREQARDWPWRSDDEMRHMFDQLDEARSVFESRASADGEM